MLDLRIWKASKYEEQQNKQRTSSNRIVEEHRSGYSGSGVGGKNCHCSRAGADKACAEMP